MAELILTQEEKDALSYLDWDDASLGRAVKKLAVNTQIESDRKVVMVSSLAMALCGLMVETNAGTATYEFKGLAQGDKTLGDFIFTVQRVI